MEKRGTAKMNDSEGREDRNARDAVSVQTTTENEPHWTNFLRGLTLFSDDYMDDCMEDRRSGEGEDHPREEL